jgi:1-acyl-sn-glycerol-3-phosphate acyltransferase
MLSESLLKPIYFFFGVVHLLLVYVTMFFNCNVLPVFSWFFIRPLSETAHERLLCLASERSWGLMLDWAECVGGLSLVVTGDLEALQSKSHGSNKLLISNHVSFTDAFVMFAIARAVGQHGHIRSFAKQNLIYQPVFGLFWRLLNFIFLVRDWDKDRAHIARQLAELTRRSRLFTTSSFWLLIFPEGTRIRPRKLLQSREYAAARGLPPFDRVLFPRVKGLQATLAAIHPALDGAVDITLGYPSRTPAGGARPSVGDLLFGGGARWRVHVHVRAVPAGELPAGDEAVAEWVMGRFREKDRLLAGFAAAGAFPGAPCALPPATAAAMARRHAEFAALAALVLAALVAAGRAAAAATAAALVAAA